ncbi:MAG: hypothetical protein O7B99_03940 [Planctomycetota bacterium]|nr:hypothetical protein [Planctomycetota bacterium]
MSKRTVLALLLIVASAAPALAQAIEDPGPHPVGWRDVTFVNPGGGGNLEARIYYPALAAGQGAPSDPAQGPYPLVAMLHGWLGSPSSYDELSTHVASWGFVLGSIDTETGFFGSMQPEAQDAANMLAWIDAESDDPTSFLLGMASDDDWSATGHSMGGGALFYLIGYEPKVRVIVPLQPYKGTSLGGSAGSTAFLQAFDGALLIVTGELDTAAPASTDGHAYFELAGSARRGLYTEVLGMGHLGPTDSPPDGEPLSGDDQHRLHRRLVTGFLRAEILGEEELYLDLLGEGAASEPLVQESASKDPPFWAAPSVVQPGNVVAGLAATPGDQVGIAVSLAPASIPTIYGTLGLDLSMGTILHQGLLVAPGILELAGPVPPSLSGVTLWFQGLALGTDHQLLTSVSSFVAP